MGLDEKGLGRVVETHLRCVVGADSVGGCVCYV